MENQFSSYVKKKISSNPRDAFMSSMSGMSMPKSIDWKQSAITSNKGAVGTTPISATPAKEKYMENVSGQIGQERQPLAIASLQSPQGFSGSQNPQPSQIQQPPKINPMDAYKASFDAYIKSLQPSSQEMEAQKYLNSLVDMSKREIYDKENMSGVTMDFAGREAERARANRSFDVQAASDALSAITGQRQAMTEAQKARLQFEQSLLPKEEPTPEGFSLSEGQARYDAQGNLIAQRGKTYAPSSASSGGSGGYSQDTSGGTPSSAAQNILQQLNMGANLDDLIKGNSISAQNLRNEVLGALNKQGGLTERQQELFTEAQTAVNRLLDGGYKKLGGYSTVLGKYTTGYGDAKAQAQQLQAILARDNLGLLKGAMSDKDLAFIQSMSSGFEGEGIQSEKFIKERLEEIKTKLDKKVSANTTNKGTARMLSSPDGQVFDASDLTNEEYQEAINDGYIPK